jgi:hypothetical protein
MAGSTPPAATPPAGAPPAAAGGVNIYQGGAVSGSVDPSAAVVPQSPITGSALDGSKLTPTDTNKLYESLLTHYGTQVQSQQDQVMWNGISSLVNQSSALAAVITKGVLDGEAIDAQMIRDSNGFEIAQQKIALDEALAEIHRRIEFKKIDQQEYTVDKLAEVEKKRSDNERIKSVENTKTLANRGFLNDAFYSHGKPKQSTLSFLV